MADADTPADAEEPARAAISEEEVSALLEKSGADTVQPFDLSARRISRTQLPMLEILSKAFAQRASNAVSTLLNREATVQFENLHSAKAADLHAALPVPACIGVVRIKPLPGMSFVCVDPPLLLGLLDGFFGGSGREMSDPAAAAAPAAQRFLSLLIRSFLPDLAAAWAPVTAVEAELVKQESNPRFLQFGDAQQVLVVAKFSVELGAVKGHLDWLLPESLIAPVREALGSGGGKPAPREQAAWAPTIGSLLRDAQIEARGILAETAISLGELVRLAPGDIIPIEPPQQVTLLAGKVPLYRGRFGISQGRNAVKILSRGSA
jgi:flagellar motor switch protein FliM